MVGMGKGAAGAGEATRGQRLGWLGQGLLFQSLHQDAFQTSDVDKVHLQSFSAGGIQPLGRVALT